MLSTKKYIIGDVCMAKLQEKIHNAVSRVLEENEGIKAVGQLQAEATGLKDMFAPAFVNSFWYVAITDQRVIFIKLTPMSAPDFSKTFKIPFPDVNLEKNTLSVESTDSNMPKRFQLYFGAKWAGGLDKDAFVKALYTAKVNN
jgi:hypothetical protein